MGRRSAGEHAPYEALRATRDALRVGFWPNGELEEFREYRACRLFGLTHDEYDAMPWQTLELWFAFDALEREAREE